MNKMNGDGRYDFMPIPGMKWEDFLSWVLNVAPAYQIYFCSNLGFWKSCCLKLPKAKLVNSDLVIFWDEFDYIFEIKFTRSLTRKEKCSTSWRILNRCGDVIKSGTANKENGWVCNELQEDILNYFKENNDAYFWAFLSLIILMTSGFLLGNVFF